MEPPSGRKWAQSGKFGPGRVRGGGGGDHEEGEGGWGRRTESRDHIQGTGWVTGWAGIVCWNL